MFSPAENVSVLTAMGVCGLTRYQTRVWLEFVTVSSSGEKVANEMFHMTFFDLFSYGLLYLSS